jgi:hypothetical protein
MLYGRKKHILGWRFRVFDIGLIRTDKHKHTYNVNKRSRHNYICLVEIFWNCGSNSAHEQTYLSNDIIHSVLRHGKYVGQRTNQHNFILNIPAVYCLHLHSSGSSTLEAVSNSHLIQKTLTFTNSAVPIWTVPSPLFTVHVSSRHSHSLQLPLII